MRATQSNLSRAANNNKWLDGHETNKALGINTTN